MGGWGWGGKLSALRVVWGKEGECVCVWKAEKPRAEGLVVPLSPRPTPGSLACAPSPPSPSGRQQVHTGRGACSVLWGNGWLQGTGLEAGTRRNMYNLYAQLPARRGGGGARRPEGGWVGGGRGVEQKWLRALILGW